MIFTTPLQRATLVRRYKRFLSDVTLPDGELVTAHVANSGAMLGLADPGLEVWLSHHPSATRKLAWSWELARIDGGLVGINTMHPNAIVAEAIASGTVAPLAGYSQIRREVPYGTNSRVDLLLTSPDRPRCYVEVKNVHLKRGDAACFPDAVTARGTKHLHELTEVVKAGDRAVMLFLVQREDCCYFMPASDIDPVYSQALLQAAAAGVEVYCYACRLTLEEIRLDQPLPLRLSGDGRSFEK
ncbi:DNA/RNA nuclease SfsA [Telmatospirillum siberiense]|uniref:Sugar fermentation stimulation protein homolog n=1 Tax=Telmatospirillum siberiense TaxID=382514 RepID=A0A2N3Q179_9PROT|nr:DNA/RNA nuclease SfsA [Telmatospirillum siberiense]PKU26420.1 DNA/RNA nuclease SfsA [Telmatospirillum siberiense]